MNQKYLGVEDLNTLLNLWHEKMHPQQHEMEKLAIGLLDMIGRQIGYGNLASLAEQMKEIQCYKTLKYAVVRKRVHFENICMKLPDNFEEIASKKLEY